MMDAAAKAKMPGLMLLAFSTFVVCVPAPFTQIISFDLMLDLNSFPTTLYSWTFPAFVAGECSAMGLCACLLDRYGRSKPYLLGSLLFIGSTAACALTTEMMHFVIFRFIEGFGTGIIIVACIAQIFFDVEDKKVRYTANGVMSLGFGGGMLFGIFAGMAAVESIGWPAAFMIFAVLQAILTYPALQVLRNGDTSDGKADFPGAITLMVWAASFVIVLQKMYIDWGYTSTEALMAMAFVIAMFILFILVEFVNPHSVFHRKVYNGKLIAGSLIFVVILGIIDMGAVGYLVKTAFFTYGMSVAEAAPYFLALVCGSAVTAVTISKKIDETGHFRWLILSAILSPIALVSMVLVKPDEPSILLAVHLFALGLAIGCLVSMLNATIQNRTTKHSNGAVMSFTILIRTAALWLGYNFYQLIVDAHMSQRMGGIVEEWNAVLSFDLPSNSALANMLMTPFGDALRLIPGITNDISTYFAEGVGVALIAGAVIFVVVAVPTSILLVGREKQL